MDKFRIEVIKATPNPQQVIWLAMHQDYAEDFVWDKRDRAPDETKAGEKVIKHLLSGERGHWGPCFDSETKVLTERGFIYFADLLENDQVACFDLKTKSINFEIPEKKWGYHYEGEMLRLHSRYTDQMLTPDHHLVLAHRRKDSTWTEYYRQKATATYGRSFRFPVSGYLSDKTFNIPSNLAKLAGFYLGDGESKIQVNACRFRIKLQRKIDYLYSLGFEVEKLESDHYRVLLSEAEKNVIKLLSNGSNKKLLPKEFIHLDNVEDFLDGLKNSDGTRLKQNSFSYDSTSFEVLETLQEMLSVNGYATHLTENNPSKSDNHLSCYRLHISHLDSRRFEPTKNRTRDAIQEWVDYQGMVYCVSVSTKAVVVKRNDKVFVSGNCEHPQITFNVGFFPHSMMQQIRTHRVGISFDCQSFRYTGKRILDVAEGKRDAEEVFYLRPVGEYTNRQGKRYFYSEEQRQADLEWCIEATKRYQQRITEGLAEEHARGIIPFDTRQHFVMSCNARSLMHLLDLRWKKDAQLEAQKFSELLFGHFQAWTPQLAEWYLETRAKKAKLSP